jgi:hypothetical protein
VVKSHGGVSAGVTWLSHVVETRGGVTCWCHVVETPGGVM